MTKLFAALGPDRSMRFIGEVLRGAACGCVCPECGSPLMAKQGTEKEWHFAHVSGQERPECEAGAANMMRRLAMESLRKQQPLELPLYKAVVTVRSPLRVLSEEVTLQVRSPETVEWLANAPKASPVGRARLEGGGTLEIFIGIGNHASHGDFAISGAEAVVLYFAPMPEVHTLRTRGDAEKYLSTHGKFAWLHLVQKNDVIQAAKARLREQAQADEQEYERACRRRAQESQTAWSAPGASRQAEADGSRSSSGDVHSARADLRQRGSDIPEEQFAWAPNAKSRSSFTLYRFRDGAAWVIYTLADDSRAIAAWPNAEEGWDEALPPSIATADKSLGAYRIHDLVQAVMFLRERADIVRSTSNPREFDDIA